MTYPPFFLSWLHTWCTHNGIRERQELAFATCWKRICGQLLCKKKTKNNGVFFRENDDIGKREKGFTQPSHTLWLKPSFFLPKSDIVVSSQKNFSCSNFFSLSCYPSIPLSPPTSEDADPTGTNPFRIFFKIPNVLGIMTEPDENQTQRKEPKEKEKKFLSLPKKRRNWDSFSIIPFLDNTDKTWAGLSRASTSTQ